MLLLISFSPLFSFKFILPSSDFMQTKSVAHCPVCLYALFLMICKDEKGGNSQATNQYLNTKQSARQQCRPVWLADCVWVYDTNVFFTPLCIFLKTSPHFSIVSSPPKLRYQQLFERMVVHMWVGGTPILKGHGCSS